MTKESYEQYLKNLTLKTHIYGIFAYMLPVLFMFASLFLMLNIHETHFPEVEIFFILEFAIYLIPYGLIRLLFRNRFKCLQRYSDGYLEMESIRSSFKINFSKITSGHFENELKKRLNDGKYTLIESSDILSYELYRSVKKSKPLIMLTDNKVNNKKEIIKYIESISQLESINKPVCIIWMGTDTKIDIIDYVNYEQYSSTYEIGVVYIELDNQAIHYKNEASMAKVSNNAVEIDYKTIFGYDILKLKKISKEE